MEVKPFPSPDVLREKDFAEKPCRTCGTWLQMVRSRWLLQFLRLFDFSGWAASQAKPQIGIPWHFKNCAHTQEWGGREASGGSSEAASEQASGSQLSGSQRGGKGPEESTWGLREG